MLLTLLLLSTLDSHIYSTSLLLQSYVLEIVLTLESAVDYVEDDELQPSNVNPVTPHKYSDMRPLSSSSTITCMYNDCIPLG